MEALLLLGGNLGEPRELLQAAEGRLFPRAGRLLARSRDHWTEPWGFADDRPFLNRALLLDTPLGPETLLALALDVETALGRVRGPERYGPRCIDIDILWMGDLLRTAPAPILPHPRMAERRFALAPAADVAPGYLHPVLRRTVLELLDHAGSNTP